MRGALAISVAQAGQSELGCGLRAGTLEHLCESLIVAADECSEFFHRAFLRGETAARQAVPHLRCGKRAVDLNV